jgi:phosphofructokinase-like protein
MAARKKPPPTRIAILTGGGDCPGLNAVIRAVARTAQNVHGWETWGVRNGVEGFLMPRGEGLTKLEHEDVAGILTRGGTILGASNRCDLFAVPRKNGPPKDESGRVKKLLDARGIHALVVVGGDGTHKMAARLQKQGVNIVGVPKTIDNDIRGTDRTFGFDSAVGVVGDAIDRLYTTAESHQRVMLLEVMGRDAGWIALHGGLSGGVEAILLPEIPYCPDRLARKVLGRQERGLPYSIVVVSEGARRPDGAQVFRQGGDGNHLVDRLGGVSYQVAAELQERTSLEVRNVVLGHLQRGGSPSPLDRTLGSLMGRHAIELIAQKRFGRMVAVRGMNITSVEIARVARGIKTVAPHGPMVTAARELGISFAAADGSDDPYAAARRLHGSA